MAITYEMYLMEEARIAEEEAWWEEHEEEIEAAWNAAEEAREKMYTKFPYVDFTPYRDYKRYSDWYNEENVRIVIDEDSRSIMYNKYCDDFWGDVVIKKPFGKLKEDIERRFYGRFAMTAGAQA